MIEDSLTWLQIDSVQKQQLEFLSRVPSSIQSYAMAARQLRGDTIYHRYPYIDEPSGARLAGAEVKPQRKQDAKTEVDIYPNPNKGIFTLNISTAEAGNLTFQIIDITGRTLHSGSFVKREIKHTENLHLDHLSAGIYFCRIYAENKEVLGVQRLIISR